MLEYKVAQIFTNVAHKVDTAVYLEHVAKMSFEHIKIGRLKLWYLKIIKQ